MIGIYKITNPNGKIYVGQSINIEKRFLSYKRLDCKNQIMLYRSFLKYGYENHKFEVIEECDVKLLNELERYWQDFYNCIDLGLNCKTTSFNSKTGNLSTLTKDKIREKAIGRKSSEETKLKKSLSMKGNKGLFLGKKHSTESKIKISNSLTGKKRPFMNMEYKKSKDWIEKMSKSMKGKKHSKETKLKMSLSLIGNKRGCNRFVSDKQKEFLKNKFSKVILDTENGIYYFGTKEASFYNNIPQSTLKSRLNGRLKNNTTLIYC